MRTIKKYLFVEISRTTLIVSGGLIVLFSVFDFFKETRDIGQGGYHLSKAIFYVLLGAPEHFYELFPIAALIGTVFSISQLVLHSEYTVMRGSGLSVWQTVGLLMQIALVLSVPAILTGEFLVPQTAQLAMRSRLTAIKEVVAQQFPSGFWFRDHDHFVNVYNILPDRTLSGIKIFQTGDHQKLTRIVFAQSAEVGANQAWLLKNVQEIRIAAEQVQRRHFDQLYWPTSLSPEILTASQLDPTKLSSEALYQTIKHLEGNQQQTFFYQTSLWAKVFYPLSVMVMVLLGVPFSYFHQRSGGVSGRVFIGIMLGLGFYLMNKLALSVGQISFLPTLVSALLPSMFTALSILVAILYFEKHQTN